MKPLFKTKRALLSTILALVLVIGVGATLAYLSAADARLTNTFSLAEVDTEIKEDGHGKKCGKIPRVYPCPPDGFRH